MVTFFKGINKKIQKAVKKDFPRIKKMFKNEKPYAVAFVTDSDCVTISLRVNTYEFLEKTDAKYAEGGDDYTTKWDSDDWGYSDDWADSGLVKISDKLSKKMDSIYDKIDKLGSDLTEDQEQKLVEEYQFTKLFLEAVTSAFQELIRSNIFGLDSEEVTYFISMTDDEKAVEIENNSANVLNSKKVYEEFLKRKTHY